MHPPGLVSLLAPPSVPSVGAATAQYLKLSKGWLGAVSQPGSHSQVHPTDPEELTRGAGLPWLPQGVTQLSSEAVMMVTAPYCVQVMHRSRVSVQYKAGEGAL